MEGVPFLSSFASSASFSFSFLFRFPFRFFSPELLVSCELAELWGRGAGTAAGFSSAEEQKFRDIDRQQLNNRKISDQGLTRFAETAVRAHEGQESSEDVTERLDESQFCCFENSVLATVAHKLQAAIDAVVKKAPESFFAAVGKVSERLRRFLRHS